MADNGASSRANAPGEAPATIPAYEQSRQRLKDLLQKRRQIEKQLAAREESIYQRETEYLENTPSGNIITGFDNYTKGVTGAAAQRRKTGLTESNRVFSRSSISYNANHAQDAQTPGSTTSNPASHAPTPVSSSFKDSGSNHPTPTSATASKAAGATKTKKKGSAAANSIEDSETDGKEPKKVRTNFGVVKK